MRETPDLLLTVFGSSKHPKRLDVQEKWLSGPNFLGTKQNENYQIIEIVLQV
jgi:hypothetical protein